MRCRVWPRCTAMLRPPQLLCIIVLGWSGQHCTAMLGPAQPLCNVVLGPLQQQCTALHGAMLCLGWRSDSALPSLGTQPPCSGKPRPAPHFHLHCSGELLSLNVHICKAPQAETCTVSSITVQVIELLSSNVMPHHICT